MIRRRNARAGFTLIEVMVSLGVMMVGALAIIGLQQHTIRSNRHSRELSIATQIAQLWVERLKQDAATWNAFGPPPATAIYLNPILANLNSFQQIPNATAAVSNAFDFRGNDVSNANGSPVHYCAAIRPAWVETNRALRVDVRVWWSRERVWDPNEVGGVSILTDFPNCGATLVQHAQLDPPPPGNANLSNKYHVIYMPSVITMQPVFN
jgi:Tfp pilus assembly protein PilV